MARGVPPPRPRSHVAGGSSQTPRQRGTREKTGKSPRNPQRSTSKSSAVKTRPCSASDGAVAAEATQDAPIEFLKRQLAAVLREYLVNGAPQLLPHDVQLRLIDATRRLRQLELGALATCHRHVNLRRSPHNCARYTGSAAAARGSASVAGRTAREALSAIVAAEEEQPEQPRQQRASAQRTGRRPLFRAAVDQWSLVSHPRCAIRLACLMVRAARDVAACPRRLLTVLREVISRGCAPPRRWYARRAVLTVCVHACSASRRCRRRFRSPGPRLQRRCPSTNRGHWALLRRTARPSRLPPGQL